MQPIVTALLNPKTHLVVSGRFSHPNDLLLYSALDPCFVAYRRGAIEGERRNVRHSGPVESLKQEIRE
jgi:hypothetical protein